MVLKRTNLTLSLTARQLEVIKKIDPNYEERGRLVQAIECAIKKSLTLIEKTKQAPEKLAEILEVDQSFEGLREGDKGMPTHIYLTDFDTQRIEKVAFPPSLDDLYGSRLPAAQCLMLLDLYLALYAAGKTDMEENAYVVEDYLDERGGNDWSTPPHARAKVAEKGR